MLRDVQCRASNPNVGKEVDSNGAALEFSSITGVQSNLLKQHKGFLNIYWEGAYI
jgi:hypothetical protein